MTRKLSEESFHFYIGLGDNRSYAAVAERFGASVRGVTKYAAKNRWPTRLAEIQAKAREDLDRRLQEEISEANERHLKVFRYVQGKAIEALKEHAMTNATEALRCYVLTLDRERVLRGEPSDRIEHRVEDLTRREIRKLVGVGEEADDLDDLDGDDEEDE